ncbi:MAG: hypothetical protein COW29_06635 [Rhodobacterales bacterium CG15_BIG_FIL_POST_REV_8_21_14_020_59_13]|nr:MAG: hypothetical protein COW29_06635 [Rhodobacterales bacterium CG15_BIG_FIL_POST_REV_8_21_14_020_59_13]
MTGVVATVTTEPVVTVENGATVRAVAGTDAMMRTVTDVANAMMRPVTDVADAMMAHAGAEETGLAVPSCRTNPVACEQPQFPMKGITAAGALAVAVAEMIMARAGDVAAGATMPGAVAEAGATVIAERVMDEMMAIAAHAVAAMTPFAERVVAGMTPIAEHVVAGMMAIAERAMAAMTPIAAHVVAGTAFIAATVMSGSTDIMAIAVDTPTGTHADPTAGAM